MTTKIMASPLFYYLQCPVYGPYFDFNITNKNICNVHMERNEIIIKNKTNWQSGFMAHLHGTKEHSLILCYIQQTYYRQFVSSDDGCKI